MIGIVARHAYAKILAVLLSLQEAWTALRRKLARGSLPIFTILQYHPLQFQLAHLSLQEYLTAEAICNGCWPDEMTMPWKWGTWWAAVSNFGEKTRGHRFGYALLKKAAVEEIVLDAVSGDVAATASAVVAIVRASSAAGGRLPLKAGALKDVLGRIKSVEGQARAAELELGSLPIGGLAVFCRLLTALADPPVTAVDLSKNEISAEQAPVLVSSLAAATQPVTRVVLDRNELGDTGAAAFCTSLVAIDNALTDIDLGNNHLGPDAAEAVAALLRQSLSVSRLVLTSNGLCGVDWQGAGEQNLTGFKSICGALGMNPTLRELHLRANGLDTAAGKLVGEALAANKTLESLSLWKNSLGTEGIKPIVKALSAASALTLLDLRDNRLDDDAGVPLAQLISKKLKISSLLLADNKLGPAAGAAIGKAWAACSDVLAVIDIRANLIDKDAAKALRTACNGAAQKRIGRQGVQAAELFVDDGLL